MNWTIKITNKVVKQVEKLPKSAKATLLLLLRDIERNGPIELAKILNISQTNLSAMENGRRAIGKELARRIAEQFEVDYRSFL
jgi:transcriptional regulator with XRE-family HTH domain